MSKVYNTLLGYFLLLSSALVFNLQAKEVLHIAVASNFKPALHSLLKRNPFPELEIKISTASSGVLFSQISHGAPYDIFLSADTVRPQALIQQNLAVASSLVTYAQGQLALWQPQQSPSSSTKVAIANPRFSPYGQASKVFLQQHMASPIEYVYGSNITHAFQFVDSGNAAIGVVAYSSLLSAYDTTKKEKYLAYTLIDADKYPPILQQGVILTAANRAVAQRFMDFLMAPQSQQILTQLGYKTEYNDASK